MLTPDERARIERIESLGALRLGGGGTVPVAPIAIVVFHNADLVNDGVAVVIGSISVAAARAFMIIQQFVLRDNIGRLLTVWHRLSINGDPAAPTILNDQLLNQVSNLTALPIILNSIIGTNMTLTMTNPALAASALDVTIYNEIYEGLGSPP